MQYIGDFEYFASDILGHGAFALVFKGHEKGNKQRQVAIKKIRKTSFPTLMTKERKEISILIGLHHKNIVKMFEYHETNLDFYLILELCNMGDLNEFLQTHIQLSEEVIRYFFSQIGDAIHFIHSHQIIHRDLKPQNILLNSNTPQLLIETPKLLPKHVKCLTAKIADFGFARVLADATMATTLCGSPLYMAPEVLLGDNYDSKVDMWSIGAIIYQCFTGSAPFIAKTPQLLKRRFETDKILQPPIPINASIELKDLLIGLLKRKSAKRMGYGEFCSHSFFTLSLLPDNTSTSKRFSNTPVPCSNKSYNLTVGHQYMFVIPQSKNKLSIPCLLEAPNFFKVSPNSKLPYDPNEYSNCNLELKNEDDDNNMTQNGFVLISNILHRYKLNGDHKLDCFSSQLYHPENGENIWDVNFSGTDKIPFSSLATNQISVPNKTHQSEALIHTFVDHNLSTHNDQSKLNWEHQEKNFNSNNLLKSLQFTNNSLPKEVDKKSLLRIESDPISTMFATPPFLESVHLSFDLDICFLQLNPIECPFLSQDINTCNFDYVKRNHALNRFECQRNDRSVENSHLIHTSKFDINEIAAQSENNNFDQGGIVILEDLKFDSSQISASFYQPLNTENLSKNNGKIIHQCLQTILFCQYIFDVINILKFPIPATTQINILHISNPINVSIISRKLIVLHVKIVKLIIDMLEKIKNHNLIESNKVSTMSEFSYKLISILEVTNSQLCYVTLNFNKVKQTKREVSYIVKSAEGLIYNQMISICQNAVLERYFDFYNENFIKQYKIVYNICELLYISANDKSLNKLAPFILLTK